MRLMFICAAAIEAAMLITSAALAAPAPVAAVNPKDYGAKGDGVQDDTAAINQAIAAACSTGAEVTVSAGTYRVVPAAHETDEAGATIVAFPMCSNLHIRAEKGSTFKIADGISTNAAPVRFAMFFSNQVLHDISIRGVTFDMNGANNPISPARGKFTYNHFTQAAVIFSGTPGKIAAGATNVTIEECEFLNTAGVSAIVMAQSNTAGVVLGKHWVVRNNRFWNNGLDTDDHSSVFGWADDVLVEGNTFGSETMFSTTGVTGCNVAYEIHGAGTRFLNNKVSNCHQGMWVGSNYTSPVKDILIQGNTFDPLQGVGIDFYRMSAREQPVEKVVIDGNTFHFSDGQVLKTGSGQPARGFLKVAVQIAAAYSVTDVSIVNNKVSKDGENMSSAMVSITPQQVAGQAHDNIVVRGNTATNLTFGVFIATNAKSGLGQIKIDDNSFTDLSPSPVFAIPQGIAANGAGTIQSLSISGNTFTDARSTPKFQFGIRLSGTITTLSVGAQHYKGMASANYSEVGLTVKERKATSTPAAE